MKLLLFFIVLTFCTLKAGSFVDGLVTGVAAINTGGISLVLSDAKVAEIKAEYDKKIASLQEQSTSRILDLKIKYQQEELQIMIQALNLRQNVLRKINDVNIFNAEVVDLIRAELKIRSMSLYEARKFFGFVASGNIDLTELKKDYLQLYNSTNENKLSVLEISENVQALAESNNMIVGDYLDSVLSAADTKSLETVLEAATYMELHIEKMMTDLNADISYLEFKVKSTSKNLKEIQK